MMEYFDSEAISSIDLQIEHVFNENWRDYLLRDLESMYSVFLHDGICFAKIFHLFMRILFLFHLQGNNMY